MYLKESKAYVYTKNLYMNVLNSIIHNSPRAETTQVSIHKWMDKPKSQSTQCHAAHPQKKNEVLTHATMWMNPENMIRSTSSPTQKATYWLYDPIYVKCPQ